jgi:hypothetical protein
MAIQTEEELRARVDRLLAPWRVRRSAEDATYDQGREFEVSGICEWLAFVDSNATRFHISIAGSRVAFYVDGYSDLEGTGLYIEEAALDLLGQVLEHICVDCRSWDGHDGSCPYWMSEAGQDDLRVSIADGRAEHYCRDGDIFKPALGRLVDLDGWVSCDRCGWPLSGFELGEHGRWVPAATCPWTSADECAAARERSVAGVGGAIPACAVHGEASA